MLLQILFTMRSERLRVEGIDYNLRYRWFVGLAIDDPVWDHPTFGQNRDRLFNEGLARVFFERVKTPANWKQSTGSEHFRADGTLIDAWASHTSFRRKDDDGPTGPGRNAEMSLKGQAGTYATCVSTTDPDARLYEKSAGTAFPGVPHESPVDGEPPRSGSRCCRHRGERQSRTPGSAQAPGQACQARRDGGCGHKDTIRQTAWLAVESEA